MHILVVDDDQAVRDSLARSLHYSGWEVTTANDGIEALARLSAMRPDAVIMDVMMPRLDGLDAGADDYMAKPFSFEELQARLRALTRRVRPATDEAGTEVLSFADLSLDLQTREVTRGGRRISLTRTEFALLQTFLENPRRVLERSWLLNEVWGFDFPTTANSLEVYIGYLRRKTEGEGEPRLIHTVRGIGYVLRETPP